MSLSTRNVPILGSAARGWLTQGNRGRVLAVVNHAAYLLTEGGEVVWLVSPQGPMHRRCVRWPVALPSLSVDTPYMVRDRFIDLESGKKMDLRSSQVWQAPAFPVKDVIDLGKLPGKLFAVMEPLLSRELPLGFGIFIRPLLQIAGEKEVNPGFQPGDVLARSAWPVIEKIARSCLRHDLSGIEKEADALVGLGEGLTPSGDDFLGGIFFSRTLLACAYPNQTYLHNIDLAGWIEAIRPRTNLISFGLLQDNISGHALEPLNHFGFALLTHRPLEEVTSAALDLIQVGHSTGWSLLAGFLTGMLMVFLH
jgi:hypothetical protein